MTTSKFVNSVGLSNSSISVIRDLKTLRHGRPQVRDFLNTTLKKCANTNQCHLGGKMW